MWINYCLPLEILHNHLRSDQAKNLQLLLLAFQRSNQPYVLPNLRLLNQQKHHRINPHHNLQGNQPNVLLLNLHDNPWDVLQENHHVNQVVVQLGYRQVNHHVVQLTNQQVLFHSRYVPFHFTTNSYKSSTTIPNHTTEQPSRQPTRLPTSQPSRQPLSRPTTQPSRQPSSHPSKIPTSQPTRQPSRQPTSQPTRQPSQQVIL